MREPPRPRADAEDEFVKRDPWKKYPRRGDGGGDDGGSGGGGGDSDGGGDGDGGFFIGTPPHGASRGFKKAHMYEHGKLFEVKDAKSLPDYNGKANAGLWRKKVSYYLISKYHEMEKLLEWVERKKEVVDSKVLANYNKLDPNDSIALSKHLWGFLNISLPGDAWETFGNVG